MPKPKRGSVALSAIQPSPEELEEARATIATAANPEKKRRAAMSNFQTWLKQQGGQENPEALLASGDLKQKFLDDLLVWQMREKIEGDCQQHQDDRAPDRGKGHGRLDPVQLAHLEDAHGPHHSVARLWQAREALGRKPCWFRQ